MIRKPFFLSIKCGKETAGPEKINDRVLHKCASELAELLYLLFRQSPSDGIVYDAWKDGHITPIPSSMMCLYNRNFTK